MHLIRNPWDNLFYTLIRDCKKSLKITSPFVKRKIVTDLLSNKSKQVNLQLITSCKLINFYRSVSDTDALKDILNNDGKIYNYQALHAKIYLFDDSKAVVTSSNLTEKGLKNNFEYGIYLDEPVLIKQIDKDFNDLIKNENTGIVKNENLTNIDKILNSVPKEKRMQLPRIQFEKAEEQDLYTGGVESIISNLKGWRLDVFQCLLKIKPDVFKLIDVYAFEQELKSKHPENLYVKDKIRQILQNLRDIGLIQFLSSGVYKKLWIQ